MQYDVRRDPKSAKPDPQAGQPGTNGAPLLRERLIDVVRRDRAIAAIAVAQNEGQRDAREVGLHTLREPGQEGGRVSAAPGARELRAAQTQAARDLRSEPALDPEVKSGTHARVPGYTRPGSHDEQRTQARLEEETDAFLEAFGQLEPAPRGAPVARAPIELLPEEDDFQAVELIASWIEEEIIEIDAASDIPIMFMPEPPPLPEAARRARKAAPEAAPEHAGLGPVDLVPNAQRLEQGLELILEADAEITKQEPIRTRTMARLLSGHGYSSRALSIYDYLLTRDPNDAALRAEADALRAKKK